MKGKPNNKTNRAPRGTQGRKDNGSKRVNFDNSREKTFMKDVEEEFKADGSKCTSKSNDVKWYSANPELLRAAASIPFSTVTGQTLPFKVETVPGIMGIYYMPTIGSRSGDYQQINAAKNDTYSFTVHKNSRNESYDGADEMMVILAGAQLFSFLALGIRAYGLMRTFDQRNAYLPAELVKAMGFDYQDLRSHLSQMWFDLNELVARSKQIWIPNKFPVIERWFWMNSNVYMDGSNIKGQYYVYAPSLVYQLSETASQTGTSLIPTAWDSFAQAKGTPSTWANYMSIINGMFDALLESQDRGIIMGDILKAYGEESIYKVNEISSDYTVLPVYDVEVLTQIENLTTFNAKLGNIVQDDKGRIRQGSATATSAPNLAIPNYALSQSVLNFHTKEIPTPEAIMIATRLKVHDATYTKINDDSYLIQPYSCGTEIVQGCAMFGYQFNQSTGYTSLIADFYSFGTTSFDLGRVRWWTAFDWAPWIYRVATAPDADKMLGNVIPNATVGDFDQWTVIDTDTLDKMHSTALYSEFGVPTV